MFKFLKELWDRVFGNKLSSLDGLFIALGAALVAVGEYMQQSEEFTIAGLVMVGARAIWGFVKRDSTA